jgi:D-threonine aldolase
MTNDNWYLIGDVDKLDSPALVVYPERVKANIQLAISMTGDVSRLRPHVKTNKSPDAVKLMIEMGIFKFKCATIAEAEMLAQCEAKDVLLAYQPIGPKLQRFIELIKKYPGTQFSCLTDDLPMAIKQAEAFAASNLVVPVYMDLNVGMDRTGIVPGKGATALFTFLSTSKNIEAAGIHAYDGHIRDKDIAERTKRSDEAFAEVKKLKKDLESAGLQVLTIIAGGSPTFPIHAQRKEVECSPGTFIYWDKGYLEACPEQHFMPAAVLVMRVLSFPAPDKICLDLGHKSVAAENEITRRIFFLNAEGLTPVSHSEEHLVLETDNPRSFKTGDVLYGIPYHVCPTVALYERVYTIEQGKVSGEWRNSARDRKLEV